MPKKSKTRRDGVSHADRGQRITIYVVRRSLRARDLGDCSRHRRVWCVSFPFSVLPPASHLRVLATGPQSLVYENDYAYNCGPKHHAEQPCVGGVLLTSGAIFEADIRGINPLFQSLGMNVYPFMKSTSYAPNQTSATFNVTLYGANENTLWVPLKTQEVTEYIECFQPDAACLGFTIMDEPNLVFTQYSLVVQIPGGSAADFLGDFLFQWQATNPSYMIEEMVVRILLAVGAMCVAILMSIRMSRINYKHWTMEQSWGLLLAYCLVFLNNLLFPLRVFTASALFPIVFALFEAVFVAVWLLYSLLYLEMVRCDEHRVFWESPLPWLKMAAVGVYFILFVALSMWEEALFFNDPIVAPSSLTGPSALFFVVAFVYAAIVVWIVVLLIFITPRIMRGIQEASHGTFPDFVASEPAADAASSDRLAESADEAPEPGQMAEVGEPTDSESADWHEVVTKGGASSSASSDSSNSAHASISPASQRIYHLQRLHSAVPIVLVTASTMIGVLSGNIGPFGRTAAGLFYFFFLYNLSVYFLIYGYWPVGGNTAVRTVSTDERRPLVENPFANADDHRTDNEVHPLF